MTSMTKICPHCGAILKPRLAPSPFSGSKAFVFCGWEECDCEGAKRERKEREIADKKRAEKEREERHQIAYRRAGIKPRFLDAQSDMADSIIKDIKRGIGAYICGPVGTGKTYLASAVARVAIDSGMSVKVTDTLSIMANLKSSYHDGISEDSVLDALSQCQLLILDDLGKESPTDWTLSQVFHIVNDRYENVRPILVTTQFSKSQLIQRLAKNGDTETAVAIVSRLSEMCRKIELLGKDRRLSHGQD